MAKKQETKRKNKSQSGITLIALVITIIVLLILAGISIQMLTGENSILSQAGRARTANDETQIKEKIQLAYHSALTEGQGSYTKESLENELKKEFQKDYSVDDSDDLNWIITVKGQRVTIPAGKKIIVWNFASEIFDESETNQEKMHIGDYINYPIFYNNVTIHNTSWTGSAQLKYTGWRVLGSDGEGEDESIILISTGVPLSFYFYTYKTFPPAFHTDTGNVKLFQTAIQNYGYNTFRACGFKVNETDENTITTISDLSNLFNNQYTQISNDFPRVRIFRKSDISNINNTLFNVESNISGQYTPVWLGGGSKWDLIQTNGNLSKGEENEMGIRLVVYLKSNVKYSLASGSHKENNNEKTWNIEGVK